MGVLAQAPKGTVGRETQISREAEALTRSMEALQQEISLLCDRIQPILSKEQTPKIVDKVPPDEALCTIAEFLRKTRWLAEAITHSTRDIKSRVEL